MADICIPLCFLLEMVISESIFLFHQPRRSRFPLRFALVFVLYATATVATHVAFSALPNTIPYRMVFFLAFFGYSVAAVAACFRLSLTEVVFVATAGYSVQHIADSVVKILLQLLSVSALDSVASVFGYLIAPYAICAALFYFLFIKGALLDEKMQYGDKRVLAISGMNLVLCLVLSVTMDSLTLSTEAIVICKVYAMLGCVLCLLLQVGLFQDGKMAQTNKMLQQMIRLEQNQHRISKETIDFINIKCHDLKHQIDRLNNLSDEKRQKNVAQLSKAIMIYDSIIKTGNDALDMVLMEKKLLCEKYNIQFSYVVDGACLNHMDEVDVYSLFGNMLDNAIESLSKEPDEEKRTVTLRIHRRMKMVYISIDNYCSTPVVVKDGEIQTTKQHEPGMHGYGIKSIAYIVNSYRGDLIISTENHHFVIEIMLPADDAATVAAD